MSARNAELDSTAREGSGDQAVIGSEVVCRVGLARLLGRHARTALPKVERPEPRARFLVAPNPKLEPRRSNLNR